MAAGLGFLTLRDFRGGRNGADPLLEIPEPQCAEAINVDWYRGMLARRRPGSIGLVPPAATALTFPIFSLIRFVPGQSERKTELFAFESSTGFYARYQTWFGWSIGIPSSVFAPSNGVVHGVSFNNKLFLAAANTLDVLHCWDPLLGHIRPVGLPTPPAPAVTPFGMPGTGTITGTRYYRTAWTTQASGVTIRRSDLSGVASAAVTNDQGWFITVAPVPFQTETHWELYAAANESGPWYLLQTLEVATTTALDTIAIANFPPANATLAPVIGSQTPAPNGKYLLVDEARLLIAGSHTTPAYQSRVWWTPILNDASGANNDERVNLPQRPFIDFDPGDSGEITGVGGPLFDSPYVFKLDRVYKMVRTGLSQAPYRPVTVSKKCGAIHHRTIVLAEDETGAEAIYFLSRRGPYRVGVQGVQYCGRDIEDLWAMVNLNAAAGIDGSPGADPPTIGNAGAHGVYHADVHQVWWYVPVGDNVCPTLKLVFDTRLGQFTQVDGVRRGWAQHTGASSRAWASTMFADGTIAQDEPETDSLLLKPYLSQAGDDPLVPVADEARIWMADHGHVDEGSAPYVGLVRSRAFAIAETVALHGGVLEGHIVISPGVTSFSLTTLRDYGIEVRGTAPLTAPVAPGIPRLIVPVRDLAAVSAAVLQVEFLDAGLSELWELDQIVLRIRREEDR